MPTLDDILEAKRRDLELRKRKTPIEAIRALASMQQRPASFLNTVRDRDHVTLIGSIQYTPAVERPSGEDPVAQAIHYARAGLDTIALFTDRTVYSGGMDDLMFVVRAVQPLDVPVITQDYIFDEYQVVEARAAGASGLVLDSTLLNASTLRALVSATQRNRMTAIVRVGDERQLRDAVALSPQAVALCHDPECTPLDADEAVRLRALVPTHIRVGVSCAALADVECAARLGVQAVFLGKTLLSTDQFPTVQTLLH